MYQNFDNLDEFLKASLHNATAFLENKIYTLYKWKLLLTLIHETLQLFYKSNHNAVNNYCSPSFKQPTEIMNQQTHQGRTQSDLHKRYGLLICQQEIKVCIV